MKKIIILVCVFSLLFSTTCFAQQMDARTMVANVNSYLKSYNSASYCDYFESRFFGRVIHPDLHLTNYDARIVSSDFESGNYSAHAPSAALKYIMDFYYADDFSFRQMSSKIKMHNSYSRYDGVKIKFFDGLERGFDSNSITIKRDAPNVYRESRVTLYNIPCEMNPLCPQPIR